MPKPPASPKIYHILHVDRLPSVIADGRLLCDAEMAHRDGCGTTIGMDDIKLRRLNELMLDSHPGLYVGQCVPFYFCPRSVMLYIIWQANHPGLKYRGGQQPIVHIQADLLATVKWAEEAGLRWAFTLSNAGAYFFEDRSDLGSLHEVNWNAVDATRWAGPGVSTVVKDGKQAEFLLERQFPWHLVERIGVISPEVAHQAIRSVSRASHRPGVEVRRDWYY